MMEATNPKMSTWKDNRTQESIFFNHIPILSCCILTPTFYRHFTRGVENLCFCLQGPSCWCFYKWKVWTPKKRGSSVTPKGQLVRSFHTKWQKTLTKADLWPLKAACEWEVWAKRQRWRSRSICLCSEGTKVPGLLPGPNLDCLAPEKFFDTEFQWE